MSGQTPDFKEGLDSYMKELDLEQEKIDKLMMESKSIRDSLEECDESFPDAGKLDEIKKRTEKLYGSS